MHLWDLNHTPLVFIEGFKNSVNHLAYRKVGEGGGFHVFFFNTTKAMQLILWYFIRQLYKPARNFNTTENALQSNGAQQSCLKVREPVLHDKAMPSVRMAPTARDKTHRRV